MRTTREDPRYHRKHLRHRHQASQEYFDDADERSYTDNSNLSPLVNGENKTISQVKFNKLTNLQNLNEYTLYLANTND